MTVKTFYVTLYLLLFACLKNYTQQNFYKNIKSIKLLNSKTNSNYPVIGFNDHVYLSFDDIEADEKDYYFKINHYNYKWNPSKLLKSEFLNGFDDIRIDDYKSSYNTLQSYTHYKLKIPNNDFDFKVSGNYSISVHLSNDRKVFEKRFLVNENLTSISMSISRSNKIEDIESSQNIDATINCNNCTKIYNSSSILKLIIIKNNNWLSSRIIAKPKHVLSNKLIFREINFKGGNEYLSFDTSNINSTNYRIYKTDLKNLYNNYLVTDFERTKKKYEYNPDINGSYKLNSQFSDFDIENDYSNVHFTLKPNSINLESKVYIVGEFNDFKPDKNYELTLNKNKYEGSFKFKQGYYNYIYCYISQSNPEIINYFGGDFWETENTYSALLYQKKINDKYFKLIGHSSISSSVIKN